MAFYIDLYAITALCVALRLGYHMMFVLDQHDWRFNTESIWIAFTLSVVFWPFLLLWPIIIVQPNRMFRGGAWDFAATARERAQLREDPPPCGAYVRYRPLSVEGEGEFFFRAVDVQRYVRSQIVANPDLDRFDVGSIWNWVRQSDSGLLEPTPVPEIWDCFSSVADELVREGVGRVICLSCGHEIDVEQISTADDAGQPGWNFDRLLCPNRHVLLEIRKLHLMMVES